MWTPRRSTTELQINLDKNAYLCTSSRLSSELRLYDIYATGGQICSASLQLSVVH